MTTLAQAALGAAATAPQALPDAVDAAEVRDRINWLIQLRWIAVIGLGVALIVADFLDWVPRLGPAYLTAAGLLVMNLLLFVGHRRWGALLRPTTRRWVILGQLCGDLAALSLILHWTGGLLNPFVMFCVFPVTLTAILLPGWMAVACGVLAFLLLAGLVACELVAGASTPPFGHSHEHLRHYLEHPAYLLAMTTAAAMTLFGIVFCVNTLVRRQREAEASQRQHERIAQSRERLARVGVIAAGVAHSVRNPLHGVFNCLDLVRLSQPPAETEQVLALMGEGLTRIEKVMSRLLELSRETPLNPVLTDLATVVRETLNLLDVRMQNRGIAVRMDLQEVPKLRLDPLRLQEALFNIVDNAVAAVDGRPERRIELRIAPVQDPFPGVCLEIADTGIGAGPEVVARVFDPFFSTKPVGEGTGLGLAIAKEVVEAHGGEIRFKSTPKVGTTVQILLPILSERGSG